MLKSSSLITVVVIGLTFLTSAVYGQEIHVCTENWPPYNYESDGEIKGVSTMVVKAVLEEAGLAYKIDIYPWARAYDLALNQKNTLIYTIARTPEREKRFKWVGEITPADSIVVYKLKKRDDIHIKSVEDLKHYTSAVVKNTMTHQYLLQQGFKEGRQFIIVANSNQNVKMLFEGRIDVSIHPENVLRVRLQKLNLPYNQLEGVFTLVKGRRLEMAFSLQTPDEIVNRVRKALYRVKP